ncbi:MAG: hypothetical protein QNL88_11630 [Acidobacteriota bacterium]|nr:hypothetical protein [Acidobacteriota bacterium]
MAHDGPAIEAVFLSEERRSLRRSQADDFDGRDPSVTPGTASMERESIGLSESCLRRIKLCLNDVEQGLERCPSKGTTAIRAMMAA